MTLGSAQVLEVAARFSAATRAGDTAALAVISEPDAVVWHNFDDRAVPLEESAKMTRWLHRTVPDVGWEDVAVLPTPEGFVWRAVITGSAPGGALRAHTCMVVTLSPGGRIRRCDEYLDRASTAVLAP